MTIVSLSCCARHTWRMNRSTSMPLEQDGFEIQSVDTSRSRSRGELRPLRNKFDAFEEIS